MFSLFAKTIKKSTRQGFTLLEVMIAIFFLIVGVGGAVVVIQSVIAFTSVSVDKVIAANLIQEGIEIVRNIRDTNWLKKNPWDQGIPVGSWEADYRTKSLNQPYVGNYLKIDHEGFYSYLDGEVTKFKREIRIKKPSPDIIEVLVRIQWEERRRIHSLFGQENLYNWFTP